jgi:transcriptional regulator with XRE-family HTH domain
MPPVKRKPRQRRRHYIKEWREFRGLTQERVSERLDVSPTTWGRIETNKVPYNQDFLEEAAEALNCEPWDLLNRNPFRAGEVVDAEGVFRSADPDTKRQITEFIEFVTRKASG